MRPARPRPQDDAAPEDPPRSHRGRVVGTSALALALTAPGQTPAVSVFVDPLIADLGVSRSTVSAAYLVGSLAGALVMPLLGRAIDRFGPRRLMIGVALAFGAVLLASSLMTGVVGLTASFIGIRMAGQGALNLVATTTVAIYVHRRRGFAIGLVSALGTAGISLTPVLLERLVAVADWRTVWAGEGLVVWLVVVPAALLLLPRRPPAPPGAAEWAGDGRTDTPPTEDLTVRQALHTGMFWVVAGGVGACSLIATALTFHQQSLLGERGLVHSVTVAASAFGPLLLAAGRDAATSYRPVLLGLAVLPVLVVVAAIAVRTPRQPCGDPEVGDARGP